MFFIHAAGWPIWMSIAASLIALTIILERLYSLRTKIIVPPGLLDQARIAYHQLGNTYRLNPTQQQIPLGYLLNTVLAYQHYPSDIAKDAIETTGSYIAIQLNRYLNTLGTIATLAPLLGLFGTIIGMIDIFSAQSLAGQSLALLSSGIAVALYNTAFGIIVAVPSLLFYRYFRGRVEAFLVVMEYQAFQLMSTLNSPPNTTLHQ